MPKKKKKISIPAKVGATAVTRSGDIVEVVLNPTAPKKKKRKKPRKTALEQLREKIELENLLRQQLTQPSGRNQNRYTRNNLSDAFSSRDTTNKENFSQLSKEIKELRESIKLKDSIEKPVVSESSTQTRPLPSQTVRTPLSGQTLKPAKPVSFVSDVVSTGVSGVLLAGQLAKKLFEKKDERQNLDKISTSTFQVIKKPPVPRRNPQERQTRRTPTAPTTPTDPITTEVFERDPRLALLKSRRPKSQAINQSVKISKDIVSDLISSGIDKAVERQNPKDVPRRLPQPNVVPEPEPEAQAKLDFEKARKQLKADLDKRKLEPPVEPEVVLDEREIKDRVLLQARKRENQYFDEQLAEQEVTPLTPLPPLPSSEEEEEEEQAEQTEEEEEEEVVQTEEVQSAEPEPDTSEEKIDLSQLLGVELTKDALYSKERKTDETNRRERYKLKTNKSGDRIYTVQDIDVMLANNQYINNVKDILKQLNLDKTKYTKEQNKTQLSDRLKADLESLKDNLTASDLDSLRILMEEMIENLVKQKVFENQARTLTGSRVTGKPRGRPPKKQQTDTSEIMRQLANRVERIDEEPDLDEI